MLIEFNIHGTHFHKVEGLRRLLFYCERFARILRGDLLYVSSMCHFVLVFLSPFSIAITSLGEERANLSAFRTFFSICACLDLSVSSSFWGLGRAAVCDCGTPWTFLLPFLHSCSILTTGNDISIVYV